MMSVDRRKLYQDPKAFFDLDGNAVMKLTRGAAIEACGSAADRAIIIVRIEGGISSGAKFEARRDAIWDGLDPPVARNEAQENNLRGADFIRSMDASYNAFVLTSSSIDGYAHRQAGGRAQTNRQLAEGQ